MQPINIIAAILILGLQLIVIGIEANSKSNKIIGGIIMIIGWILNIIANCMKLR